MKRTTSKADVKRAAQLKQENAELRRKVRGTEVSLDFTRRKLSFAEREAAWERQQGGDQR